MYPAAKLESSWIAVMVQCRAPTIQACPHGRSSSSPPQQLLFDHDRSPAFFVSLHLILGLLLRFDVERSLQAPSPAPLLARRLQRRIGFFVSWLAVFWLRHLISLLNSHADVFVQGPVAQGYPQSYSRRRAAQSCLRRQPLQHLRISSAASADFFAALTCWIVCAGACGLRGPGVAVSAVGTEDCSSPVASAATCGPRGYAVVFSSVGST